MLDFNELPAYLYCDDMSCGKHYLNFNRDIQGKWSYGFIEFESNSAILGTNGFLTLDSAATHLKNRLKEKTQSQD